MAILKVARMGHPILRARARPLAVGEIRTDRIQKLIDDMFETVREYQGIGLAAPQVHESLRLFVAGVENGDEQLPPVVIINPEVIPVGEAIVEGWEGCLSVPDVRGRVPRAEEIKVRAYDREGKRIDLSARGFPARVIQHETDHLDGILFLDRMKSFETLTFMDEFARYWTHEEVPAE